MKRRKMKCGALLLLAGLLLTGCAAGGTAPAETTESEQTELAEPEETPESPAAQETQAAAQRCVVIDPGHQLTGDPAPEPIGPGASETKARVAGGTIGRFTGIPEYECNLRVSLLLRDVLESRGYRVVMTRQQNDVSLSNRERAELAAQAKGDIFVRLHANGSEDPSARGAMTICMTPNNLFHPELYADSALLSACILDEMTDRTGCVREKLWETDSMSGINWSEIPTTIVEMGYMTNEEEDRLLADEAYRMLLAEGIADGIDRYFAEKQANEA